MCVTNKITVVNVHEKLKINLKGVTNEDSIQNTKFNSYNYRLAMHCNKVRLHSVDPQKSCRNLLITQNFQHHVAPLYSAILLIYSTYMYKRCRS